MAEPRVRAEIAGQTRPPATPPVRRRHWFLGNSAGRFGVFAVILGAALGALVTVLSGSTPGALLGGFVIAATAVAAVVVRPKVGYLIIPVPALAYLVAAMVAGVIHDRGAVASRTLLAVNVLQWIASGFFAMIAATALALVVAIARWLWAVNRAHRSVRRRRSTSAAG